MYTHLSFFNISPQQAMWSMAVGGSEQGELMERFSGLTKTAFLSRWPTHFGARVNQTTLQDRIHICKNNNDATNGIETYGWNDHNSDRIDSFICEKKANVVDVFGKWSQCCYHLSKMIIDDMKYTRDEKRLLKLTERIFEIHFKRLHCYSYMFVLFEWQELGMGVKCWYKEAMLI